MTDDDATTGDSPFDRLPGGRKVRALHGAIEHSLAIQRDRLSQTLDDFVGRGKIDRADADDLMRQLISNSQGFSEGILGVIDSAVAEARKGLGTVIDGATSVVEKVRGR